MVMPRFQTFPNRRCAGYEHCRVVFAQGRSSIVYPGRSPLLSSRAATPLRAILEIAFAHIHSRFRTYNDLCSRFRSWRPERQQSFHRRPTALRCRPISLASRRRTAAPPRVSRQSRHARRRVDHHLPRAPDAGGQSSRSPGSTERTDRPRAGRAENPPPQSAHARLQGPSAHGKVATILLKETARPDKRRLSWLIRSRNALLRMSAKATADARFRDADCLKVSSR
jgi:hypothetical protein